MGRPITNIEEMKSIELDIMKKIHTFCTENDIGYCLAYGTLLGAVRHSGFIPWDDDIDIFMKADDYAKFKELFPAWAEKQHLYFAYYENSEHRYNNIFGKVCDDRTILVQPLLKERIELGVFVDVFMLDNFPDNALARKIYSKRRSLMVRMLRASRLDADKIDESTLYSPLKKRFIHLFSGMNTEKLYKKIQRIRNKHNKTITKDLYSWDSGSWYSRDEYDKRILHKFEDAEFYIPSNYDEILKKDYGDYMQLPPESQRVPHHVQDVSWIAE